MNPSSYGYGYEFVPQINNNNSNNNKNNYDHHNNNNSNHHNNNNNNQNQTYQTKSTSSPNPSHQINTTTLFSNILIESKHAKGKVFDICQDTEAKGMLMLYEYFKMPNQIFDIIRAQPDTNNFNFHFHNNNNQDVHIINKKSGKYLTISANSINNGVPVFQQPTLKLKGQVFQLQPFNNSNQYIIRTFCNKVLDCYQEGTQNGTRIVQYQFLNKNNQVWGIKQAN